MDILLLQIDPAVEPSAKQAADYSGAVTATNLGTCFSDVARARSTHPAVATRANTFSYSWIARAADQVRQYLSSRPGHVVGARVALQLPNSPEYVAAFYGTLLADCVVVPLPVSLEERRRGQILELSQPDVLISTPADFNAPQQHSTPSTLRLAEKSDPRDSLPPPRRQNQRSGDAALHLGLDGDAQRSHAQPSKPIGKYKTQFSTSFQFARTTGRWSSFRSVMRSATQSFKRIF